MAAAGGGSGKKTTFLDGDGLMRWHYSFSDGNKSLQSPRTINILKMHLFFICENRLNRRVIYSRR
jgi:hypothetical protein